ncbi:MAG: ABC transporter ATP-binding protein [Chloroflexaceae bacterium]|nr:ABC transporter ATP-binding protein [Chloroflexaceae bacterium]
MITVHNLTYTYQKATQPAVKGIDFTVEPGEIFGFLGPSGAGKSTTQKILIGLLKHYQGSIRVMDRELNQWQSDYYEHIGVSFELPNHYLKLTALENLHYFRSLYRGPSEDPQALLALVGLEQDGHTPVGQFSKGMQMRLNVVRALMHRPRLVFLDEPTSGLDPVNAQRIKELIRQQQANGTTFFLTTHNMHTADELCDRVAFLVDGTIKLIDSPRTLKLQHGKRSVQVEYLSNGQRECCEFALDGLGQDHAFFELLQQYPVETIHTQETTLEQIFIQATGRSLQ